MSKIKRSENTMEDAKWREQKAGRLEWMHGKKSFKGREIGWRENKITYETGEIKQKDGKKDLKT
jgi:hypothetical protein